eukprot:CAMPEP_0119122120 /NCGR_PEP_ID=MMETSP1310-20130426/2472_1 /TAXON_ID=464262 /ORGANISM="Genus nov. species nov., Strain RCC2339" /LENGTH=401 /DNA_ID=CAMNT_0007111731 /DNA_START=285 /DNA_END=1490 /DNA_ORIENTATION=-
MAVTTNPDEMVLSWLTQDPVGTPTCAYGESFYSTKAYGYTTSYSDDAGYNHNVKLTGLSPNTRYVCTCGDETLGVTNQFSFTTRDDSKLPMTFGIVGDVGVAGSDNTIQRLNSHGVVGDYELFWHLGDISYANDHPWLYEHTWNSWFRSMEDTMNNIPYMTCVGNHEVNSRNPITNENTGNFTSYKNKFRMPGWESGSNTSLFYSFDYGLVHFVAVDTEDDYPGSPIDLFVPSSESQYLQVNWLEEDLTKAVANRANVPWIVVGGHRNIYNINSQKDGTPTGSAADLQAWLEPVFEKYNVDLFLSGHAHNYQRIWPTANNVVEKQSYENPVATTMIIAGHGGNIEGHEKFESDTPSWFAFGDDENFGYAQFKVFNETTLEFTAFRADRDEIIDQFVLTRQR